MIISKMSADILVRKLYAVDVLAHVTHINTPSYSAHEALGEFYSVVSGMKDRLAEYLIGEGKLVTVKAGILEVGEDVVKEASDLANMLCDFGRSIGDEAIINMSGEFKEAVGKLKYLLTKK